MLAVVVCGAAAILLIRHRLEGIPAEEPPGFWFRFSLLLWGFRLFGPIEGVMLSSYRFGSFLAVMRVTLYLVAKIAPKFLNPRQRAEQHTDC